MRNVRFFRCFPVRGLAVFLAGLVTCAGAAGAEGATEPSPLSDGARLLATFDAQPLAAVYTDDAKTLAANFSQTNLCKMLRDPSYAKAAQFLGSLLEANLGANVAALWPDLERNMSGPAALAILPPGKAGDSLRLELAVLAPNEQAAGRLGQLWPKAAPQADTLLAVLKFVPVKAEQLPPAAQVPRWALPNGWPQGQLMLRAWPQNLAKVLPDALKAGVSSDTDKEADAWVSALSGFGNSGIERLGLAVSAEGAMFSEELAVELAPAQDTALARVVRMFKDAPGGWEALMAALPADQDVVVLAQTDPKALGDDLPYAMQALERYLRGKKFVRTKARTPEVLAPDRFAFLLERLQGSFGVSAVPAVSGGAALTVAAALKPGDTEAWRQALIKGLGKTGAEYVTQEKLRKIGGVAPLVPAFQGHGLLGAPVIGLSSGWAWLCSNSMAYYDLTNAFKARRTMDAEAGKEKNAGEALRLRVNLDRIMKLVYAIWMFSDEKGPAIGAWRIPPELVPQPALFAGKLGVLQARLARKDLTLNVTAGGVAPGVSLGLAGALQALASEIDQARNFARAAQLEKSLELRPVEAAPQPAPGKSPEQNAGGVEK